MYKVDWLEQKKKNFPKLLVDKADWLEVEKILSRTVNV